MKPLRITEEAREEFLREVQYLEKQRSGSGKKFREAINATLSLIRQYPEGGKPASANTRRMVVRNYNFLVAYREEEDQILVYAIPSTRRAPDYWLSRLNDC